MLCGALAATFPVWLPWVLRPVAATAGLHYESSRRLGWTRIALNNVSWSESGVTLRARQVEVALPSVWFWRRWRGPGLADASFPLLSVAGADLTLLPAKSDQRAGPQSAAEAFDRAQSVLAAVVPWLTSASCADGSVTVGSERFQLPFAVWSKGRLQATVASTRLPRPLQIEVLLTPERWPVLLVRDAGGDLVWSNRWTRTATNLQTTAQLRVGDQPADFEAAFAPEGWWPRRARFSTKSFPIPRRLTGWPHDTELDGNVDAAWDGERYVVRASGRERPRLDSEASFWHTPIEFELLATGDRWILSIERLQLRAPGLRAELAEPKTLRRGDAIDESDAELHLAADLDQVPRLGARGQLRGVLRVPVGFARIPRVSFDLTGRSLEWRSAKAEELEARGTLDWPLLAVTEANAVLPDSFRVHLAGEMNLASNRVARVRWGCAVADLSGWLPAEMSASGLSATGTVQGPFSRLAHAGHAEIAAFCWGTLPKTSCQVSWEGEGTDCHQLLATVEDGQLRAQLDGAIRVVPGGGVAAEVDFRQLSLLLRKQPWLQLVEPVRARFALHPPRESPAPARAGGTGAVAELELAGGPLRLAGPGGELELALGARWPEHGQLAVRASGLRSQALQAWLPAAAQDLHLVRLEAGAGWTNDIAAAQAELRADWTPSNAPPLSVQLRLAANPQARTELLELASSGEPQASASGDLPLRLEMSAGRPHIRLEPDARVSLQLRAAPSAAWCDWLRRHTGFSLQNPRLEVSAGGSWREPRTRGVFTVEQLTLPVASNKSAFVVVDDLRVAAEWCDRALRVAEGSCRWNRESVRLGGAVPLESTSNGLWHVRWPEARATMDAGWDLASLAALLPTSMRPSGRLATHLEWRPDGHLQGEVELQQASFQLLESLPALRNVDARIGLEGQRADLTRFRGRMGGVPVSLEGGGEWTSAGPPIFALRLRTTNAPLARAEGVIVRGDVALELAKTAQAPPQLTGRIGLRNSLLVSDLFTWIGASPSPAPSSTPSLGLTNPTLAQVQLDVRITGDRALRVRTPILQGVASANVHLRGSLGVPTLTGEIRMDEGAVLFPFGRLALRQATAGFTPEAPLEARLFVTAASRVYGYQVQMEVTGTPADANILFSSTPPLSAQEILLLLTAGRLPRDEARFSTADKISRLGMFLGQDLLDRFTGNPGDPSRLELRSGQDLSVDGRTSYELQYRLSPRWSLFGELDRFGAINGGLKCRIFSR